jgi:hypothetical protein
MVSAVGGAALLLHDHDGEGHHGHVLAAGPSAGEAGGGDRGQEPGDRHPRGDRLLLEPLTSTRAPAPVLPAPCADHSTPLPDAATHAALAPAALAVAAAPATSRHRAQARSTLERLLLSSRALRI